MARCPLLPKQELVFSLISEGLSESGCGLEEAEANLVNSCPVHLEHVMMEA